MKKQRPGRVHAAVAAAVAAWVLAGCGGGGGGSDSGGGGTDLGPSSSYAQRCAPGNPESTGVPTGSLTVEKQWLRSYFDEAYLWRDEVPVVNASAPAYSGSDVPAALQAYFDALLTPQRTASGAFRDRFSFMISTREWEQLASTGSDLGYGITWTWRSTTPPRQIRVAQVEPGSPAARAGVQRGDTLLSVDTVPADAGDAAGVAVLNEALFPTEAGRNHAFVFATLAGSTRNASLAAAVVTLSSVPVSKVITAADGSRVGYLLFNDHLAASEAPLIQAVTSLRNQGITDLVLDLRYNGGGYLFIASELATMIAGTQRTSGQTFQRLQYNSRRSADNNSADSRMPFFDTSCVLVNGSCSSHQTLPTLNLSRVFVLTQADTCSASESVINGLRGVNLDVRLIGGTTCGKPYGFTGKDNCGYSYFPIEFSGVNAKGFGDYADGFVPAGGGPSGVAGCNAADDLSRALGDPAEGQLATALRYRADGSCIVAAAPRSPLAARTGENLVPLSDGRHPARRNTIAGGRPAP